MTQAEQRQALLRLGLRIPARRGTVEGFMVVRNWRECEQPDILDNEEYNVIVKNPRSGKAIFVKSIDLDFRETE